ncbi:MAG: thiamine-phosphate kinase [Phycisphaerales bacterium]|nr:MAG: thiamine-phosphate kinase [Phycisphaerales bacterium]
MAAIELEFVQWLQARGPRESPVELGIGDDMAIVQTSAGQVLLASDMMLDGVHFDSSRHDLRLIGRKAVACNLSDCAAMAVKPLASTVSVAWPRDRSPDDAKKLFEGMDEIAREYGLALVGGDTVSWDQPLAIDVSIAGVPYEGIKPVTRSGARVGDILYVTGPLGGSVHSGHHLTFTPRVREARALAEALGSRLHAMMDLSDGLALDLHRLCQASGVGAIVEERRLEAVISEAATAAAANSGRTAIDHALSDGEDFELLFTVKGEIESGEVPVFPLGRITDRGVYLYRVDGQAEPLEPRGFLH